MRDPKQAAATHGDGIDDFSAASISAQDGARHRCRMPLEFADPNSVPSGENLVRPKIDPLPSSVSTSWPVATSQSLIASRPLLPVATRFPSGENAIE